MSSEDTTTKIITWAINLGSTMALDGYTTGEIYLLIRTLNSLASDNELPLLQLMAQRIGKDNTAKLITFMISDLKSKAFVKKALTLALLVFESLEFKKLSTPLHSFNEFVEFMNEVKE